jgi:hypothetical protein
MKRILALGLAGLLTGCASIPEKVEGTITINYHFDSYENINKMRRAIDSNAPEVRGFYLYPGNNVYVAWDGEYPDMEALGHEVSHAIFGRMGE